MSTAELESTIVPTGTPMAAPGPFGNVGPNWFATVMGTGIVATAAITLPTSVPGARGWATAVWLLAVAELVAVTSATVIHWRRFPATARQHHRDPTMAHFYGALPMAILTVGAGTLLVGRDLLGLRLALELDRGLWALGTALGLATAASVPYLMFTGLGRYGDGAFGGWLMPVVPPMVSAATGALLVPYTAAGQLRLTLLLGCYAMFGVSLIASVIIIALIWGRLATHGAGEPRLVPTLWIVLGPLGQSVTAANLLGAAAASTLPTPYGGALKAFGLVYGLPVWGFALLWATIAAAITIRTARHGLPFSLTWWSFTFPVGTVVTATSALAVHTDADALRGLAVIGYVVLTVAWLVVAAMTIRNFGALTGRPTSRSTPAR